MPFVFAAWMARDGAELGDWPARLERAKHEGLANVEQILRQHAVTRGWPIDTARQYLTQNLKFNIGPRQIEAIKLFYELAAKNGVIERPVRELQLV